MSFIKANALRVLLLVVACACCAVAAFATVASASRVVCVHSRRAHRSACRAAPKTLNAPCAGANVLPSRSNVALTLSATLCLINRARAQAGEGPLRDNGRLDAAAHNHSESMVAGDYFQHTGPDGITALQRIADSGYLNGRGSYAIGENIALGTYQLGTPQAIVNSWLGSAEHRANIFNAKFRDSGIGIATGVPSMFAVGDPGATYTEDFGGL